MIRQFAPFISYFWCYTSLEFSRALTLYRISALWDDCIEIYLQVLQVLMLHVFKTGADLLSVPGYSW